MEFKDILPKEAEQIAKRREVAFGGPVEPETIRKSLTGLAFSGGGIRSGAFCLGVIQSLYQNNVLPYIDYLSTVSGGGYAGAYLVSHTVAAKDKARLYPETPNQPPHANGRSVGLAIAPEANGRQSSRMLKFIYGGDYLNHTWTFFNRHIFGFILNFVTIGSFILAIASLSAILYRLLDWRYGRFFLAGLGFESDVARAFFPSFVLLVLWFLAWGVSYFKFAAKAGGWIVRSFFIAFVVSLAVAFAALLGTGDIKVSGDNSWLDFSSIFGRDLQWLYALISGVILTCLLSFARPDLVVRSGTKPKNAGEKYLFWICTRALLVGLPFLLFAYIASENISGVNDRRSPLFRPTDFSPTWDETVVSTDFWDRIQGAEKVSTVSPESVMFRGKRNWEATLSPPEILKTFLGLKLDAIVKDAAELRDPKQLDQTLELGDSVKKTLVELSKFIDSNTELKKANDEAMQKLDSALASLTKLKKTPSDLEVKVEELKRIDQELNGAIDSTRRIRDELLGNRKEKPTDNSTAAKTEQAESQADTKNWQALFGRFLITKGEPETTRPADSAPIRSLDELFQKLKADCETQVKYKKRLTHFLPWINAIGFDPDVLERLLIRRDTEKEVGGYDEKNALWAYADARYDSYELREKICTHVNELLKNPQFFRAFPPVDYRDPGSLSDKPTALLAHVVEEKSNEYRKLLRQAEALLNHSNEHPAETKRSGSGSASSPRSLPEENHTLYSLVSGFLQDTAAVAFPARQNELTPEVQKIAAINRRLVELYFTEPCAQSTVVYCNNVWEADQLTRLSWLLWSTIALLFFSSIVDLNVTSCHAFYARALSEAWMDLAEGSHSTIRLQSIESTSSGFPYPLLSGAVTFFGDWNKDLGHEACDAFLFSPLYCGSSRLAYAPTKKFMEGKFTLNDAVAVSGAAVSPIHMRNPLIVFLLFLFNFRLGQWVDNPKVFESEKKRRYRWGIPWYPITPLRLVCAKLHPVEERDFCFVADGGFFDNSGVEQLLARKCRLIFAFDAGADPQGEYADLVRLSRLARLNHGVLIQSLSPSATSLELETLIPENDAKFAKRHYLVARLIYPDLVDGKPLEGRLVYFKSSITKDVCTELMIHHRNNPTFPHDSTTDQFFEPEKFEAYRQLGQHVADHFFQKAADDLLDGVREKDSCRLKDFVDSIQESKRGQDQQPSNPPVAGPSPVKPVVPPAEPGTDPNPEGPKDDIATRVWNLLLSFENASKQDRQQAEKALQEIDGNNLAEATVPLLAACVSKSGGAFVAPSFVAQYLLRSNAEEIAPRLVTIVINGVTPEIAKPYKVPATSIVTQAKEQLKSFFKGQLLENSANILISLAEGANTGANMGSLERLKRILEVLRTVDSLPTDVEDTLKRARRSSRCTEQRVLLDAFLKKFLGKKSKSQPKPPETPDRSDSKPGSQDQ